MTFTKEQLAIIAENADEEFVYEWIRGNVCDLAAFALDLLDRVDEWEKVFGHIDKDPDTAGNKIIEARREIEAERDRLREERAAEWKRAEKAEAERDDANDERDDAVDRWSRRAREAEAACKELLQVQADRDRLREENKSLREANEIDLGEKAPLIFENAELKARNEILREELLGAKVAWDMCDAVNRGLRAELREAEEVIRYVSMTDVNDCFLPNGHEMKGAYGFRGFLGDWYAYPRRMQAAVRRARERTEINNEQGDK